EVSRLESLLQTEIVQRREENARADALEQQAAELTNRLSEKIAEQQRWRQRESELLRNIRRRPSALGDSAAAAKNSDRELQSLRGTIEDLRAIQAELRTELRQVTSQRDVATKEIQVLERERQSTTHEIQSRAQELAVLRHAIFDAARVGTNIS